MLYSASVPIKIISYQRVTNKMKRFHQLLRLILTSKLKREYTYKYIIGIHSIM